MLDNALFALALIGIALTAYLLRLGTDIAKPPPEETTETTVAEIEH